MSFGRKDINPGSSVLSFNHPDFFSLSDAPMLFKGVKAPQTRLLPNR
jgi:hypothetical protein